MQRLTFCFLILFFSVQVFSQTNLLDPTFGNGGKVDISIGNFQQRVHYLHLLPDNSVLILGSAKPSSPNIRSGFLCKVTKEGVIDSSFASNGVTPFISEPTYQVFGVSIAIQSDNKIVALFNLVSDLSFIWKAVIYRFHPNGEPDLTFGVNGKTYSPAVFNFSPDKLLINNEGKITVGGGDINSNNFGFVRYLPNGTIDNTFDNDGRCSVDMGSINDYLIDMEMLPDGKILASGTTNNGMSLTQIGIMRLNYNGSLDSTFNGDGKSVSTFGNLAYTITKMKHLPNGKIRTAGISINPGNKRYFCMYQFKSDGTIDTNFGNNGVSSYPMSYNSTYLSDACFQSDGAAILGGYLNEEYTMLRVNSNGELNTGFYTNGVLHGPDFAQFDSLTICTLVAQLPDGKILSIGEYEGPNLVTTAKKFALFRFLADSVSSVPSIEQPIKKLSAFPNPVSTSFTLDYTLQSSTPVTINLYDQNGRKVQTLLPTSQRSAGNHSEQFNLQNLPSGIYSLELSTGQFSRTVQVVKK